MVTTYEVFEAAWKEFDVSGKNFLLRTQLETFLEIMEKKHGSKLLSESERIKLRRYSPQHSFEKISKDDVVKMIENCTDNKLFEEKPLESILKSSEMLRRSPIIQRRFSDNRQNSKEELADILKRSPRCGTNSNQMFEDLGFMNRADLESVINQQKNNMKKLKSENEYLRRQLEDVIKEKNVNSVLFDSIKKKSTLQEMKIQSLSNQLTSFKKYDLDEDIDANMDIKEESHQETIFNRLLSYCFTSIRSFYQLETLTIIIPLIMIILLTFGIFYSSEFKLVLNLIWKVFTFFQSLFKITLFGNIKTSNNNYGIKTGSEKDWNYDDIVMNNLDIERIINYGRQNFN